MTLKHEKNLRGAGLVVSAIFAVLLFPVILPQHGLFMALVYTGLGMGFINIAFFGVGRLTTSIVEEEAKKRVHQSRREPSNNS